MENDSAIAALAALAHPTRLDAFRLLIRHEPEGLPTGALGEASGLGQSTFSTHLAVMARVGLVTAEKRGRQQI
ncbi:ArsR/SmtB family transcription factor, partial [Acinetobacter baumannii]|uniref:ArsR/SmtB family transcription factor n=1 Tax=Acinetobacter baumannii TaxID=470 RepID=UPI0013D6F33A